jgi:hypothetical protein
MYIEPFPLRKTINKMGSNSLTSLALDICPWRSVHIAVCPHNAASALTPPFQKPAHDSKIRVTETDGSPPRHVGQSREL